MQQLRSAIHNAIARFLKNQPPARIIAVGFALLILLGAALLILCYYRSLSRNISKRTEENYRFYSLKDRFNNKFRSLKEQWANRKLYHYYRCPQCRQKLRVPRGRGRIQISCPRCGTQFIKKS